MITTTRILAAVLLISAIIGSAIVTSKLSTRTIPNYNHEYLLADRFGYISDGVFCSIDSVKTELLSEDKCYQVHANGEFLIIKVECANMGMTTTKLNQADIALEDDKDRTYRLSPMEEPVVLVDDGDDYRAGNCSSQIEFMYELMSHSSTTLTLVYDIPKQDNGLKLKISRGTFSSNADVIIPLPEIQILKKSITKHNLVG